MFARTIFFAVCAVAVCSAGLPQLVHAQSRSKDAVEADRLVRAVIADDEVDRRAALDDILARQKTDVVAGLIQAMRFTYSTNEISHVIAKLVGEGAGRSWFDWMVWQETHPEVKPFDGFDKFKADMMAEIDPNFRLFLQAGVKHEIRLEEITWGGVAKDGIPALTNPELIRHEIDPYLTPEELVFGISINGDTRAYPLRILDWHEMFNDVIGGKAVSLAYCTLCGAGILYETKVDGYDKPFVFGSSGFLYRSNKLMYDTATHSLWNQFTGRPVVGPLTGSGIELKILPVAITSWAEWQKRHPDTKVLSLDTNYPRNYTPGRPYGPYFASPDVMFPVHVPDKRLKPKDYIFVVRTDAGDKSWPLAAFDGFTVRNDKVGGQNIVLIGNARDHMVRAYATDGKPFQKADTTEYLTRDDGQWRISEDALSSADGTRFERLPGHIAFWFAWQGYKPKAEFGGKTAQ